MSRPPRPILLTPGPATTSPTVQQALMIPDVCPREESFAALLAEVRRRLAALTADPETFSAIPLAGSGTAAVEATLGSVVPRDGMVVVLDNGDYGARMAQICAALGIDHAVVSPGWGEPFDLQAVEAVLAAAAGRATHLAFVHHETATGMLNPLAELAALAARFGLRVIVDAMSSLGAVPIHQGRQGVDFLISSANKCIQGMPGLSFVIASRAALSALHEPPRRSFYLDLLAQHEHLEKTGQMRFTCPPQIVAALRQALLELEAETLAGRRKRYDLSYQVLTEGLAQLGFELLLSPEHQSHILVAVRDPGPPRFDFRRVHDDLLARGFTIYPGKTGSQATFRLAVLGDLHTADIEAFLAALREVIAR